MNIPILNRLREMFKAERPERYENDALASLMFIFVKEGNGYDDQDLGIAVHDIIEECQTYIYRDRPLQVNAMIEAEINGEYDEADYIAKSIYEQDTIVMCNLVKIREYIYA